MRSIKRINGTVSYLSCHDCCSSLPIGPSRPPRAFAESALETPRSAPQPAEVVEYATPCKSFKYVNGEVTFNIGKHIGETLERVTQIDGSYLRWIVNPVRRALEGWGLVYMMVVRSMHEPFAAYNKAGMPT